MGYFKTEIAQTHLKNTGNFNRKFIEPVVDDFRSPDTIPGFTALIDLLEQMITSRVRFMIAGDSDVDGLSSVAILSRFLENCKLYVSKYIIPKSMTDDEGFYKKLLSDVNKQNIQVLVFFDISLVSGVFLNQLNPNVKVVICDHHEIFDAPKVEYFINPKRSSDPELQQISSSGLAFKIVYRLLENRNCVASRYNQYLVLALFGSLSDMVSIKGESRTILKLGMSGILKENKYKKFFRNENRINYERVLFSIISNVNSLAKMGYGYEALEMLSADYIEERKYQDLIKKSVRKKVRDGDMLLSTVRKNIQIKDNICGVCIIEEDFNVNLLGQIAYRVKGMEKCNVILIARMTDQVYKGSVRVKEGYNAFEVLKNSEQRLFNFGGHSGAAGFMIKKDQVSDFIQEAEQYFTRSSEEIKAKRDVFFKIRFRDISHDLISDIRKLSPFGVDFPPPLFFSSNVSIVSIKKFSPTSEHFRGYVKQDNRSFSVVGLYLADSVEEVFSAAQSFNILYEIGFFPYNSEKIQFKIKKIVHKKDDLYDYFMK